MPGMILAEHAVTFAVLVSSPQHSESFTLPATATFATATAGPLSLRTRFIHIDRSSSELTAVQSRNGLVPFFCICHFYETESPRSSSFAIGENTDAIDRPIRFEDLAQLFFRSVKTEVPNENIFHRAPFLSSRTKGNKPFF